MSNRDDTYYVDRSDYVIDEAPRGGTDTVIASVSYTLPANVEIIKLVGEGLTATGNGLDNTLYADATYASTLIGGLGNDIYHVFNSSDVIIEDNNLGSDAIVSTISFDLAGLSIERLTLVGDANIDATGRVFADRITGNGGNNQLVGLGGNDMLDGGLGVDTMVGGTGDDTYYVDNIDDRVVELQGRAEGLNDVVYSSTNFSLFRTFVETLTLTGSSKINAIGNTQSNHLNGNYADNIFYGGGGDDVMIGGRGDDTYYVDSSSDKVIEVERRENGNDIIVSTANYDLTGTFVENLTLSSERAILIPFGNYTFAIFPYFADGRNINGTGNALANNIIGNSGDNVIDGRGGADTMSGGFGNDTYYVDEAGDRVIDAGTNRYYDNYDTVYSKVSFDVGSQLIERVILTGMGNNNVGGNALANDLQGNRGNNVLDGRGGVDTMTGGRGDDIYYVDNSRDRVIELQGVAQGNDTVYASTSFSLTSTFVETLVLTGTADSNATGNRQGNTLVGNIGNNVLTGGGGRDTFVFSGDFGHDRVADFDTAADVIRFAADTFTSYDQVINNARQVGEDVIITLDADHIMTLQSVALNTLAPDHFLFG
jgi:Ca2+-binding RTX toxin-like protein